MDHGNGIKHTNILAVFANPRGSDQLRLSAEDRVIRECLKLSPFRDNFTLEILHAATIHDVRRMLLVGDFQIVQFSGHGTGRELVLENALGEPQPIPPEALAECLSAYSPPIECVIFNACYTDVQGELVSVRVPFTVGINGAISDEAATEFARGFYDAIGAGKDFEFAFQEGCRCVNLTGLTGDFEPVFFTETTHQEEAQVKIVSEHYVQFRDEEEIGILDYIEHGTQSFEDVSDIVGGMTTRMNELGRDMQNDTIALNNLRDSQERSSARKYKVIIDHTAQTIHDFASHLDTETPKFRKVYSRAIDYFGKASILLTTEFDADDAGQLEESLETMNDLAISIESASGGLGKLRQSIAGLPRMTKELNNAKRHCLGSLDNFDRELGFGLELTRDMQAKVARLQE